MKSLLVLGILISSFNAQAVLISEKVVNLPVNLTSVGIRLSKSGYSMPTVKVLVPELAEETVMNHRNQGETAPCVATFQTYNVEDVVQGNPTTEIFPFKIELAKIARVSGDVCKVQLVETVTAEIRGFTFEHVRHSDLPDRVIEDCK